MKRFMKWCLILAGVLLVTGIGLHVAGAVMGGRAESNSYFARRWDSVSDHWLGVLPRLEEIAGLEREMQQVSDEELTNIHAIEVDIDYGDIGIAPQVNNKETFSVFLFWNLRGYELNYTVENGILKVSDESWGRHFWGGSNSECSVLIRVPEWAVLNELDLSTDLGDVFVSGASIIVNEADLSTNLGDVSWSDTHCIQELDAGTDLGDVSITMPWGRENYYWELETDLGEVTVDGAAQGGDVVGGSSRGGTGDCFISASSNLGDVGLYFDGDDVDLSRYDNHAFDHLYEHVGDHH